jgi:hypothetical protein
MSAKLSIKLLLAAFAWTAAAPAIAEDFSAGSEAASWGLLGEEKARFSGKVVDILCELSGDCADDCGHGTRQLGIVRAKDKALVSVLKNGQPLFNGAVPDLLPYCNANVEVDGLLIGDETAKGAKFYQVQLIRRAGETEWQKTELWSKQWEKEHPDLADKTGEWFRHDSAVAKHIEASGYFGLGKEADEKYIKENFK